MFGRWLSWNPCIATDLIFSHPKNRCIGLLFLCQVWLTWSSSRPMVHSVAVDATNVDCYASLRAIAFDILTIGQSPPQVRVDWIVDKCQSFYDFRRFGDRNLVLLWVQSLTHDFHTNHPIQRTPFCFSRQESELRFALSFMFDRCSVQKWICAARFVGVAQTVQNIWKSTTMSIYTYPKTPKSSKHVSFINKVEPLN